MQIASKWNNLHEMSKSVLFGADLKMNIINLPSAETHYKNTPIQIYKNFHLQKLKVFI